MKQIQHLLYRPILLGGLGLSLLLVLVMGIFVLLTWRNLARIHSIETTVGRVNRLQEVDFHLQTHLLDQADPQPLTTLRPRLQALAQGNLKNEILQILSLLQDSEHLQVEDAIRRLQKVLVKENKREQNMLRQIVSDTELELKAALSGLTALVLLLVLGAFLTHYWLLAPLKKMNGLLLQLAEGRFEPIAVENTGPPWRSLLDNYNHMVTRLAALEQSRMERTRSLESQVQQAARTLLAQNRNLARAERLAAVGEVAAGLAHELRNPLAGIGIALHNLRTECEDDDTRRRFDLIISELERLNTHLNQLLDQARHQPEPINAIDVDQVIREVLELLHYQIPDHVKIHYQGVSNLSVHLPETALRQALINLILNSVQALGENDGNIWVKTRTENERLILEISDDGPGLSEEFLAHGVRPFATGRDGGTGLGLLMVKRFVTSLDGRLKLGRREPFGANIQLEMPCFNPS